MPHAHSIADPEACVDVLVPAIRAFNRFYTRQLDLFAEELLKSGFSLTEARILYELGEHAPSTAAGIGADLGLDAGYLSRILKRFEMDDLIVRTPSPSDARQTILTLTDKGTSKVHDLNAASHGQVRAMLMPLSSEDRARLVQAMATIHRLLSGPA